MKGGPNTIQFPKEIESAQITMIKKQKSELLL